MEKTLTELNAITPTPLSIPKVGKQSTSNDKGDDSSEYHCDLCGKTYTQLSHLENHRTITHSLTLRIKNSYNPHTNNHHYRSVPVSNLDGGTNAHKCAECGKSFSRSHHLDRHKLIHSGIRPYKCSICSKEFTRNYHLVRHMYTHTGEKPFSCDICAKAFSRSDKLKRHSMTHMVPPYKEIR